MVRRVAVDAEAVAEEIEGVTQEQLTEIAAELVSQLKIEAPTGATGDLQRLTQIWTEESGTIVITMPEHGRYVQESTDPPGPGKAIPFTPIQKWARRKLNDESLAGPIWNKLMQEGTEANPFIDRAIQNTMERFS
jgi:hypothetical protein